MKPVFIIAEAGVNHNGSLKMAYKLIDEAKKAGVDCVKFQTFKAANIVTQKSPKANYQLKVTDAKESQFDMLKKLELSKSDFKKISDYCKKRNILFLSTPYNYDDIELLMAINVQAFKVASGQLIETPFLEYLAKQKKHIYLSTGMGTLAEVYTAVEAIRKYHNKLTILQCNTDYPSRIEDTNIKAMCTMRDALGVEVGYSDHVPNNYACYAAVSLGATVIEKHFTLDKNLPGPDHSSSLEPNELKELVVGIRAVSASLGSGIKKPSISEEKNMYGMRRSLVASRNIKKGTILTEKDFAFKRPLNGVSPKYIYQFLGKKLNIDIAKDEVLQYKYII